MITTPTIDKLMEGVPLEFTKWIAKEGERLQTHFRYLHSYWRRHLASEMTYEEFLDKERRREMEEKRRQAFLMHPTHMRPLN
jgi:hypothetical protein